MTTDVPDMPDVPEADVVAALVHELRTPLASLFATLEVIEDTSGGQTDEPTRWIRHLRRNVTWLQDMVENASLWAMLEAKRLPIQRERVFLPEVLEQAVGIVQPLLEKKGQRVRVHCPTAAPWVLANDGHLVQVLVNLLNNAGAYSPKGDELCVTVTALDQWVQIAVTDHGPGLDSAEQQYVFDRYRRGTAAPLRAGGMGLGLHIVRTLVHAYGGEVGVESTPGQGSTFWIRLQAAPVQTATHAARSTHVAYTANRRIAAHAAA